MNTRSRLAVSVVVILATLAACGDQGESKQPKSGSPVSAASTSVATTPAEGASARRVPPRPRRTGPYRFVRPPLVIVDQDGPTIGAPHAYIRLNRSLPGSSINRVKATVTVNGYAGGARTTSFSGVSRCYEQIADLVPETVMVGDNVRVALSVTGRPRGTASVTVTVKGAVPSTATDDGYQAPYLRALGCRLPEP